MKIRLLAVVSIVIIACLTLADMKAFQHGLACIAKFNDITAFGAFGLRLCIGNLLFKSTGIVLAVLGLTELLRKTKSTNLKLKLLLSYTAVALILALPVYHRHPGFGGPETHGHSFWEGGLHLH